ncbi:hypothetical protein MSAN_00636500 [Mycena sanguinolenta]|uniref:Uncharacterized protein n=1 Tax=Mycena sanguinolenta TaxID=230812 RepID=A0A8H6YZT6_9AGAR|nr:hypothetical protein MSAN_00636500 [Mycena sanguinolenta]
MEGRRTDPPPGQHRTPAKSTQTGTRRPRSPEQPVHGGEWALDSTTKSPHTNRVIKKGRTGADTIGLEAETAETTPVRLRTAHANTAQPVTTTPTPFTFAARPSGLIDRISEQLRSSLDLAARITTKPNTNDVQPLVALIQRLLDTLTPPGADPIAPPCQETKRTTTPTYAEATKAPQQPLPSKGAHRANQGRPAGTSKHRDKRPQKTARPTRLVVDFTSEEHLQPPADFASPAEICATFNRFLPDTRTVKAVTRTRAGN